MKQRRILVVDDMASMRSVISALLKARGHDVTQADSGDRALMLMESKHFDLVLSDWNMPGMTGTQLVSAIRSKDKATPVVMVTAEAERERILEMRQIGVNGYLLKPFKQDALLSVVDKILG